MYTALTRIKNKPYKFFYLNKGRKRSPHSFGSYTVIFRCNQGQQRS